MLPTLMRILGIRSHRGKPLDGVDAWDAITGKAPTLERELYSYVPLREEGVLILGSGGAADGSRAEDHSGLEGRRGRWLAFEAA